MDLVRLLAAADVSRVLVFYPVISARDSKGSEWKSVRERENEHSVQR